MELIQVLEGHKGRVWDVAWSPDGLSLCSCGEDRTVKVWTQEANSSKWVMSGTLEGHHMGTVRSVSWSSDGKQIASGSFDSSVAIWEKDAWQEWVQVTILEGHQNEVKGVAWCTTAPLLATCGRDRSVWIWEQVSASEFECVDVKQGHTQDVKCVRWQVDGQSLFSGSYDDCVRQWAEDECGEWVCVGLAEGHRSTVWDVCARSVRGVTCMVTCSDDKCVRVWSLRRVGEGEALWRCCDEVEGGHERAVYSVDWRDDDVVATGCGDNGVRLFRVSWDNEQKPCLKHIHTQEQAHELDVNCVRWQPARLGSQLLASCSDDGSVAIWSVKVGEVEYQEQ